MGIKRDIDSGKRDSLGRVIKVSSASLSSEENAKTKMGMIQDSQGRMTDEEMDEKYDEVLELLDDVPFDFNIGRESTGNFSSPADVAHSFAYYDDSDDFKVTVPMGHSSIWAEGNYNAVIKDTEHEDDMEFEGSSVTMSAGKFLELLKEEDELIDCFEGIYNGEPQSEIEIENVVRERVENALPPGDTAYYAEMYADEAAENYREELEDDLDSRIEEVMEEEYDYDPEEYSSIEEHPDYDDARATVESSIDSEVQDYWDTVNDNAVSAVDALREEMMYNTHEYEDFNGDIYISDSEVYNYIIMNS